MKVGTLEEGQRVVTHGAADYRRDGTEKSAGTKLFSVSGPVKRPGVHEIPLGLPFREFFDDYQPQSGPASSMTRALDGPTTAGPTQMQTPEGDIDYSYLCSSKVGSITKGTESLAYEYDGSLLTSESKSGTLNQVLEFAYNNDFDLAAISYAGATENLSYDNDGLLIGAGTYTITRNTANGLPEQVSGNALNRSRSFNGYGELTAEDSTVNAQPVTSYKKLIFPVVPDSKCEHTS